MSHISESAILLISPNLTSFLYTKKSKFGVSCEKWCLLIHFRLYPSSNEWLSIAIKAGIFILFVILTLESVMDILLLKNCFITFYFRPSSPFLNFNIFCSSLESSKSEKLSIVSYYYDFDPFFNFGLWYYNLCPWIQGRVVLDINFEVPRTLAQCFSTAISGLNYRASRLNVARLKAIFFLIDAVGMNSWICISVFLPTSGLKWNTGHIIFKIVLCCSNCWPNVLQWFDRIIL